MSVDLAKLLALADAARAKTQQLSHTQSGRSWYNITNQAGNAEVFIYEEIGAYGVDAKSFTAELRAITAPTMTVHISSPGGSVADGLTIYEGLRQHPAYVTTSVEGLAASAASFIFQAGDVRRIAENGILLVHDAEGSIINGTAADFTEMAALMNEMSDNVASIYADRAGGTTAQWRERMRSGGMNLGTRYIGQAAVDSGLADEVAGNSQVRNTLGTVGNAACPSHHTGTAAGTWDKGANEGRLPTPMPVATARKFYGWYDSGMVQDGKMPKAAGKLPHHDVSADGTPGAANLNGVRNALARLSQSDIPAGEQDAVRAHLQAHLAAGDSQNHTHDAPEFDFAGLQDALKGVFQ